MPPKKAPHGRIKDLRVLSVDEAAELLDKHPETIREYCRAGAQLGGLRAVKSPGRNGKWNIPPEAVEEWITRHVYNPAAA